MRPILVSMNVTLDGFMAGPDCELDWHFRYWDEEMSDDAARQLSEADTILMGRVTYCALAKHFSSALHDASYPKQDIAFAEMMNRHRKIVFSSTLQNAFWQNSSIINTNLQAEIKKLKALSGKNIILYGSGQLIPLLLHWNLIDAFILYIHPVILGKGKLLFPGSAQPKLELIDTKTCSSGVLVQYFHVDSNSYIYRT